ncbi:UNVERIFIED_CONTAM: Pentatricopeptide repeat-containing protein, mitochondrial [Sesamum calycinum]|uniref:Pentatricopeptide repeat-containing protein, mitochondrial n=1 Tax=Sesamum calycinum TaxID=2727403 RepID=A0AAW2J7H0_9LAMI
MPLHCPGLWTAQPWQFHANWVFSTLQTRFSQGPPELRSANKKITELIRGGQLEDARALFDKLFHRNTVTWNSMLSGYVQNRQIAKARRFFDEIPGKDVVSWNLMISGYVSCRGRRYLEEGRYLFDKMPERTFVSWNTMISGYAKNGRMEDALRLFNSMPEKNVVSWNAMITGFLKDGDVKRASELFKRMPRRDAASLSALVSGLIQNDDLDEAEKVLCEYGKMGNRKEDLIHAYNTLIAGYGQKGRVEDARRLFDQIPVHSDSGSGVSTRFERNVVSWNSMIMSYVKAGDMASARELFNQMEFRDTISWNTMISGYVHVSDMEAATELFSKMGTPDALSWNSIVFGFAQAGKMEHALQYFERMPQKNPVSWNTIIAGYEKNAGFKEAVKLFVQMQAEGEKPDRHTLSSLLSICAESVAQQLGMQIHQLVTKLVIPDIPLRGYASHGFAKEALELFESMKWSKVAPTYITFISVLSACAHGGLVEEGRSYFRSMISDFGIEPRAEHFASLVDVVGRYGQVEEAMDIISRMPIEPDKAVWGALLGACRVHHNVELAKVAAEALMRLEPESSGPYILLYNMYADAGRWNDADEIRMIMENNNIKKERGPRWLTCYTFLRWINPRIADGLANLYFLICLPGYMDNDHAPIHLPGNAHLMVVLLVVLMAYPLLPLLFLKQFCAGLRIANRENISLDTWFRRRKFLLHLEKPSKEMLRLELLHLGLMKQKEMSLILHGVQN